jgi:putative transposase
VKERAELGENLADGLSVRAQCELMGISRGAYYYEPRPESAENLAILRRLDELHWDRPVYGSLRLTARSRREGWEINRKRVRRRMALMGITAIHPQKATRRPGEGHQIYPYLLRGKEVTGPDQVWCADVTYIPMRYGFMYLVAVMDWGSRYVLAWRLSNTLEAAFGVWAWRAALKNGNRAPLISNTDQGSQFTSTAYVEAVEEAGTWVSMDGRGRWLDNVFIERLWRSVKHEDIHLRDYADGLALEDGLFQWFADYNDERPHQALGYATPREVYRFPESYGAKPTTWDLKSDRLRR